MHKTEKKQTKQEKRIAGVAGKPLTEFSIATAYWALLTNPCTFWLTMRFFLAVIHNYLMRQFLNVWHVTRVPVVHVDHPLDKRVPFLPAKVGVYFRFIDFWIEPLSMLIKRYGYWRGSRLCRPWLVAIKRVYQSGGKGYAGYLSTTDRPEYTADKHFRLIHRADPHLLCVPSLHIAIIVLCFTYYRALFDREGFTDAEKAQWNKSLYDEAVAIAESVLYIKQHSVNCIPAALYMMTAQFPDLVQQPTVEQFIADMFATADARDVAGEDAAAIRAHILALYRDYLQKGASAAHWWEPIQAWLSSYSAAEQEAAYAAKAAANA